jgi:hypothetical protein
MRNAGSYEALDLTRHRPLPRRYYGYTALDWLKFYGLIAGLWFYLVYTYTHYFELFDDIESKEAGYQLFVGLFSGSALILLVPAIAAFLWWASGALVNYSRWQLRRPTVWRWYWMAVLVFYLYIEWDPLDNIHPVMSRKGLVLAPNLLQLLDGKIILQDFQLGYFLLWVLFWFLVVVLHWYYLMNGFRVVWFYTQRFHRYGASVLTGFRETARQVGRVPATLDYPREQADIPDTYRGIPELVVDGLSEEQARAIIAADASGAITAAPQQPTVLFVDLGRYDYSPQLAELTDETGQPLLRFRRELPQPTGLREALVVPLKRPPMPEPVTSQPVETFSANLEPGPASTEIKDNRDKPTAMTFPPVDSTPGEPIAGEEDNP